MTSRDFVYWLQGFFEISQSTRGLSEYQARMIKSHLNLVFAHEIDNLNSGGDEVKKRTLQAIHDAGKRARAKKKSKKKEALKIDLPTAVVIPSRGAHGLPGWIQC